MKITKISKIGDDKYKIYFDNGDSLVTFDDVILKYRLVFGKEINDLENISNDTNIDNIYFKIVKKISRRMMSKSEVEKYIDKLEITSYQKEKIIDKLILNKLIDDLRLSKAFVYDRFNLSSDGPYEIRKKLDNLGVDSKYIDEAMSTIKYSDVISKLERLIKKKISLNTKYSGYFLKQKLITHFVNLGYDTSDIIDLFEKNKTENNTIKKAYDMAFKKLNKKFSGDELSYKIKDNLYKHGYSIEEINEVLKNE